MTDQSDEKSDLEKSRDIISQLKEMRHYSKTNMECNRIENEAS